MKKTQAEFLKELQQQAKFQAPLNQVKWLPVQLEPVAAIIGKYPWQTILILSGVTALLIQILTKAVL